MANDEFGQPQSESTVAQPEPQPTAPPINRKHAIIGKIFTTLAGGERTGYQVDPNTGQTIETKTPLKPGEMWRGILAAGLTGMIAGAGERGPGAAGRAFEKGGTAVQAQREKAREQAREQAQQDFRNKQNLDEITLRQHADARDKLRLDAELKEHTLRLAGLQLENKGKDLDYKAKLINMEQGFADTISRIKMLGGKPAQIAGQDMPEFEGQTADEAINAASEFYKFRAGNKDARNLEFKPVFDPDTGKYQMYVIPDPDKPITPELAKKIESIYGIKPVAGANTVREVYAWLNRPGAADEARKRSVEEAEVQRAKAGARAEEARASYEEARISRVKKSDEAYDALADIQLSLDKGEKVDPKRLAKARPVIRENLKMWLGEEAKRIKDAESGDPDAKEAATEATTQRKKWEDLWDADKGIKPPEKSKVVDGITIPAGKDVIYDPDSKPHIVDADKLDQYLADPQYKNWSKTKPVAAPEEKGGSAPYQELTKKVAPVIATAAKYVRPKNTTSVEVYNRPYSNLTDKEKKDIDAKVETGYRLFHKEYFALTSEQKAKVDAEIKGK